eukprot:14264859-Ditylum_brightwellii.AAC.1
MEEGKIYSNQTRSFPKFSSKGTKYIMVIYIYNANATLPIGLKSRMEEEMLRGYQSLYKYFQ